MRVRPNKRFVFDLARFVEDVRIAAVELGTTPNRICIECDIHPTTFVLFSKRQTSPLADTVLSLCSHVGLNPMNYLVDTDAHGVPVSEPLRHSTKDNGDCPHWCKACAAEERERNAGVAAVSQQQRQGGNK